MAAALIAFNFTSPVAAPECAGEPATMVGTEGQDEIIGTEGRDVIVGLGGQDRVEARGGDDLVCGGPGYDLLIGEAGNDELYSDAVGGSLFGDDGDDGLFGSDEIDDLNGGEGADSVYGADGRDRLSGGGGNDFVRGGRGPDALRGEFTARDTIGNDDYDGGPGRDGFTAGVTDLPVWVDLTQGRAFSEGIDTLRGIEDVQGQWDQPNRLIGDGGDNRLVGGGDGDVIQGRAGDDVLDGEFSATNDDVRGGRGHDVFLLRLCVGEDSSYDGGVGVDTLDFSQEQCGPGRTRVDLREGTMETAGEDGTVTSIENLVGSQGADVFLGGPGSNVLTGRWGRDELIGREGDDALVGGHGEDVGYGGRGADVCNGVERRRSCVRSSLRPPRFPQRR